MPWGRRGSGYFDHRRGPYSGYGRDRFRKYNDWEDDYERDLRRGRSWDRADWRDRRRPSYDGYRRRPTYYDRDGDGIDDRFQGGRSYRRPTYYDRNGDGIDDRYQYGYRPREVVRRTRYVDDYDRGSYIDRNPVVRRTTYTSDPHYHDADTVVKRTTTTRPTTSGDTVVKKTTTTRTVSD